MKILTKITAVSALALGLAMPAVAQDTGTNDETDAGISAGVSADVGNSDVSAGIGGGLSFEDGISVSLGADVDVENGQVPAPLSDQGYAVAEAGDWDGKAVMSEDGETVGTVTNAYTGEDLQTIVRISAAENLELGTDAFFYPLAADADTDGELTLPMTVAELETAAEAQMQD